MLSKVFSGAILGLESVQITVEVDVASRSLPSFQIVGLADKAVEESKERVRSAILNSGLDFPSHRITVNLAPADLPKEGSLYDLPIAVGLLLANGSINFNLDKSLLVGELSLDGSLRNTPGILPLAILGKETGFKEIFVPQENAKEAGIISGIDVCPVKTLRQLADHLLNLELITPQNSNHDQYTSDENFESDFADIKGQESAKRALEIAAAGGHNVLLQGTPGSGKTLMARTFSSILPALTQEEAIEVTKIYSVTNRLNREKPLISHRPFRSPHHTTSHIGLIGGGTKPKPGEISLAHRGVLFLDEAPEIPRHVLEALRQPLEDGYVTISRAAGTSTFPAQFSLIAACNPCPCGFLGSKTKNCLCTAHQINSYKKRLSGPFLDRIDLHVFCSSIPASKLTDHALSEPSSKIRQRVQSARNIQTARYYGKKVKCNAELSAKDIKLYCEVDEPTRLLLQRAVNSLNLSGRGYHRVLKVARTIADLTKEDKIKTEHVAESLQYRLKDE